MVEKPQLLINPLEAMEIGLEENLLRSDLNAYEQTQGILDLLSLKLNLFPSEVESLLYRMESVASGKAATHNVMGGSQAQIVMEVFHNLGLMTWESFVKNRLPILKLPDDILFALHQGLIEYTKNQSADSSDKCKLQSGATQVLQSGHSIERKESGGI